MITALVKNVKYAARNQMGSHRASFGALAVNSTFRRRMVHPDYDVTIDGFPRSSNSYAYQAFVRFNPGARVAHHLHAPMQILLSVEYGVPCLLLVRRPLDALSSTLIVDSTLRDDVAVGSWIDFHRRVLPVVPEIVVADFAEVTSDFPSVVHRVNVRYGTAFEEGAVDDVVHAEIRDHLERHHTEHGQPAHLVAVPTPEKEAAKALVRERLVALPLLAEADRLYDALLAARRACGPPPG